MLHNTYYSLVNRRFLTCQVFTLGDPLCGPGRAPAHSWDDDDGKKPKGECQLARSLRKEPF